MHTRGHESFPLPGGSGHAYLTSGFEPTVFAIAVDASADVPDHTPATVTITGPASWTCSGPLIKPGDYGSDPNAPPGFLGGGLQVRGPVGTYTVTFSIQGYGQVASTTFLSDGAGGPPTAQVNGRAGSCTLVSGPQASPAPRASSASGG